MATSEELIGMEEVFWRAAGGDRDLYEANLAPDAVHVFPGWGVSDRERVLKAVEGEEPWASHTIEDPQVVSLGADAAALVYTTRANRPGKPAYVAAITTVYRRQDGHWQRVLHQQTPL